MEFGECSPTFFSPRRRKHVRTRYGYQTAYPGMSLGFDGQWDPERVILILSRYPKLSTKWVWLLRRKESLFLPWLLTSKKNHLQGHNYLAGDSARSNESKLLAAKSIADCMLGLDSKSSGVDWRSDCSWIIRCVSMTVSALTSSTLRVESISYQPWNSSMECDMAYEANRHFSLGESAAEAPTAYHTVGFQRATDLRILAVIMALNLSI